MTVDLATENGEAVVDEEVRQALAGVLDPLDEVHGCVKVLLNWDKLSAGLRRDLLLRALRNTDRAMENLTGHSVAELDKLRTLRV
jgi:hypothetical protein